MVRTQTLFNIFERLDFEPLKYLWEVWEPLRIPTCGKGFQKDLGGPESEFEEGSEIKFQVGQYGGACHGQ